MYKRWTYWKPEKGAATSQTNELLAAVLAFNGWRASDDIWLWRGHGRDSYPLEPGMHTRLATAGLERTEPNVLRATRQLLQWARENQLDTHNGIQLPDLALLAHLQHHGAATPLLDVTVDPLVALWMAVFPPEYADDPFVDEAETGLLFAIKRPPSDPRDPEVRV